MSQLGVTLDKEGGVPRNCTYVYLNGVFEKWVFLEFHK